jgi:hypothetical protein
MLLARPDSASTSRAALETTRRTIGDARALQSELDQMIVINGDLCILYGLALDCGALRLESSDLHGHLRDLATST